MKLSQPEPWLESAPGTLTPVASSPVPYSVISLPRSPLSSSASPIKDERSFGSTHLGKKQGSTRIVESAPHDDIPVISLLDQAPVPTKLQTVSMVPTVRGELTSIKQRPISQIYKPNRPLLTDNETGDLRWNRPGRPEPANPTNSYRRIGCIADGSCFFHAICKGLSSPYQLSYQDSSNVTEEVLRTLEQAVNQAVIFPSQLLDQPRSSSLQTTYQIKQPAAFKNLLTQFRVLYVQMLRRELAHLILTDSNIEKVVKKRFSGSIENELSGLNPNIKDPENHALQMVKEQLAKDLLTGDSVQPDYILLLSDYIGADIYLLRDSELENPFSKDSPLYSGTSLHETVKGPSEMRPPKDIYQGAVNQRAIVMIAVNDNHYELVGRVDELKSGVKYIYPSLFHDEPLVRQLYTLLKNLRTQS